MHFHELVHVIQWRLLGPDRFLLLYANGLECFGYRQSPLEAMAYDLETAFASSTSIFDVEKIVAEKLVLLKRGTDCPFLLPPERTPLSFKNNRGQGTNCEAELAIRTPLIDGDFTEPITVSHQKA